jgi:hypothetical protein
MVNSFLIDPDSELVFALNHSIAKSRFPGAYDAHKSIQVDPLLGFLNCNGPLSQHCDDHSKRTKQNQD